MKRGTVESVAIVICAWTLSAASQEWTAGYDAPPSAHYANAAVSTGDGGLLVVGVHERDFYAPPCSVLRKGTAWALKIGPDGGIEWQNAYPRANETLFEAVATAADGGYFAGGRVVDPPPGCITSVPADHWLVKLRLDGQIEWQKRWVAPGGCGYESILAIVGLPDGGCAFAAPSCDVTGASGNDLFVVRVDALGVVLWQRAWHANGDDGLVVGLDEVPGGGLAVVARTDAVLQAWGWRLMLDGGGSVLASSAYRRAGSAETSLEAVDALADGSLLVAGRVGASTSSDSPDLLVARIDAMGLVSWAKSAGGSGAAAGGTDRANDVTVLGDGDIVVTGDAGSAAPAASHGWIMRLDGMGNLEWHRHYRPSAAVQVTGTNGGVAADGTFLLCANAAEVTNGPRTLWAARLDNSGLVPGGCDDLASVAPGMADEVLDVTMLTPVERGVTASVVEGDASVVPFDLVATPRCSAVACSPLACTEVIATPNPACEEDSVMLSAVVSGGEPPLRVSWDLDGDGIVDGVGNPLVVPLPVGETLVAATIADSCAIGPQQATCRATVTVLAGPLPSVTPDGPLAFCAVAGESVTLQTGPAFVSYQWTIDGLDIPGANSPDLGVTASGRYAVRVADARGCTGASVPTDVDAEACVPTCASLRCTGIAAAPDPACEDGSVTLTATLTGGEGVITVAWDLDGDTVADATGASINAALPEGTTTVTFTAVDSCADPAPQTCQASVDVVVMPGPSPTITPGGPLSFCAATGASVTLDAGAGFASYQWTLDGIDISGATAATHVAATSGGYAVRVTDANGCTGTSPDVVVDAEDCPVPGEVSDVRAGEPPLLMFRGSPDVRVDREPDATAYNTYIGRIGSWFAPEDVSPVACHVTAWTDNGDGTVTFAQAVPPGSWLLVTASAAGGEGPAGRDSFDADRRARGTWTECGAFR